MATITFRDKEYTIKEFVSIEDILKKIQTVMELSLAPELGIYTPGAIEINETIYGIQLFTDIEFEDAELNAPMPLYDELRKAGVLELLDGLMYDNESYRLFVTLLYDTISKFEKYQTSAYGILDSLKNDYNNLDLNIEKLQEKIKNKENIEYLDEVMNKMGGGDANVTPIK